MLICSVCLFACQANQTEIIPSSAVTEGQTAEVNSTLIVSGVEVTPIINSNSPTLTNCPMFPADNIWNARVDSLSLHPMSDAWIDSIGRDESFHMDFGS